MVKYGEYSDKKKDYRTVIMFGEGNLPIDLGDSPAGRKYVILWRAINSPFKIIPLILAHHLRA